MKDAPEYEFEASPGLPEALPPSEHMLWQGAPQWRLMAVHVFHAQKIAAYFVLMLVLQTVHLISQGDGLAELLPSLLITSGMALSAMGMVLLCAWMTANNALYTVTNRRVVMRMGVVITVTYNLPFSRIEAADVRMWDSNAGDVSVTVNRKDHIAWFNLWPHNRPWHMKNPQPALRCIANAQQVGDLLAKAWAQARPGVAMAKDVLVQTTNEPNAAPALHRTQTT